MGPLHNVENIVNLTELDSNNLSSLLTFTESLNTYDLKSIRVSVLSQKLALLKIGDDERWLRFNNSVAA